MRNHYLRSLITRYTLLVLLGFGSLFLFYDIFRPLTVYPAYLILNLLYGASIVSIDRIFFNGIYANIIPACIAGSAYYLLLILNLTTAMNVKQRIMSMFFLIASFLIINILRIVVFAGLFSDGYRYFDLTHRISWYLGSTLIIVLLWFGNVWLFNIKDVPVYSDVNRIVEDIKKTKN